MYGNQKIRKGERIYEHENENANAKYLALRKFKGGFKVRTLKVKSISVMLVFTLLMTVFMPLTVFATAREDLRVIPAHDWTDGNFDMSLSSTGVLTWEQQSGATGFKVWINDFVSLEPGRRLSGYIDVATASYNIKDLMDSLKLESGKYEVVVSQTGAYVGSELNPQNQESMLVTYISAYDELEAPTNVTWSGNRVTWDAVPNATGYTYEYYNSTGAYVGASNTSNTQTVALSSSEDGWYVKVKATASGYRDSQWKESTLYDSGTASETLTSLSATVTAPVGGEHPSFTVTVPDGAHYTATVYAWYDLNNNGAHLTNSDTFVTGNEYQVRIHFTANTGYEIDSASYTINGTPNYASFDTAEQRGMIFVATAPATQISELSATVTAPVGGEHPSFTVTVPDGAHYTATVYAWYDFDAGTEMTALDTFVAGTQYQVRIHFTANTGYEIESASYTINGTPNYASFDTAEQRGMNFVATAPAVTTYTVTYDANGGTGSMADATGVSGEYTLLANGFTAPDGKQFKAWAIGSVNGEQKQPGEQITITAETYIYAIWEAVEYNVTVTGGTASVGAGAPITKATMGTTVTLTAGAAPTGQMFDKWVVNGVVVDDANSATTTFVMPAGEVTATATYKDIPVVTYTVTFDSAGGSAVTAQTIEAGQKATKPADPTKAGYDFKGWTLNGSAYDFNTAVNGDITLVATWEQQQVVPTVYTVTFDSNGGSAVTAQTIEEGQKATKPADPTKSGYDFKGWTLNGSAYDFNTAVNGDITLVATWETIPAGHTCDIKPVAKVEPSCTEGGKEAYYKCEGCGKFYEDALGVKEITDLANWGNLPKLGHTESDWKSDKDNHWKECTVAACGVIIENSKAAHADTNNDGKCDTCEYNVGTTTTNPNNKPNDNPQTGDNSNMFLWIALLFVSGFGVVATTVIGKKKSSAK